jgi:uncharacterized membrane-anchored protein YhcB (DUF1043 family)
MAADPILPFWLVVTGSIVVGVIGGILFERTTGAAARRAAKLDADLAQARSDLMRYREETARHFSKSAELLGRMASDYREFLDHFVSGADELCGGNVKEISINGLERPLLDTTSATATLDAHEAPPTDSEPLAEDTPK